MSVGVIAAARRRSSAVVGNSVVDTFNRANNFSGLGTTSDGKQTWATVGTTGTWYLVSNAAFAFSQGGTPACTYLEGGTPDTTLKATAVGKVSGTSIATTSVVATIQSCGLAGRITDAANYWGVASAAAGWRIQKRVAGTVSVPTGGQSSQVPAVGDVLELVMSGTTVTLKVNGTQVAQVIGDTFNQTATKHGFFATGGGSSDANNLVMDNFSIG